MNRKLFFLLVITLLEGMQVLCLYGQKSSVNTLNPYSVTTFECAGLYWKVPEKGSCKVRYREESGSLWKNGLDLVYDSRDSEYRGSIIGLNPGTKYQVELSNNSSKTELNIATRSDKLTVQLLLPNQALLNNITL
jgi:hypothetical protein